MKRIRAQYGGLSDKITNRIYLPLYDNVWLKNNQPRIEEIDINVDDYTGAIDTLIHNSIPNDL